MLQYMTHAEHGRMPVYNPTEIEVNQKNGWVLETAQKLPIHETDGTMDRIRLIDAYEAKFGKLPHHRMKNETIKAALDGGTE